MAKNTITAFLKLVDDQFQRQLGQNESKLTKFGKGFAKGATVVAAAGTAAFVAARPLVDAASDLNEVTSKTGEIFGPAATDVEAFADAASRSAGLSKRAALEFASNFGQFGTAAGLTGADLSDFSTDLTGLTSDLASFNNLSNDEAAQKLLSGLAGETEPLRELGVFMNAAAVEAKALELGLTGVNDPLTDQEKILARTALIYEQTTAAQGDFARTSDGFANQQRILAAEFENLQAELGEKLLPIFIRVTEWILDDLI
ncbi:MAG: hypothetical protein HKN81_01960, partial [Gammaproteobacteria bacterium]|nr:hypothetical protein [Gammaproteobacteria bacterium]